MQHVPEFIRAMYNDPAKPDYAIMAKQTMEGLATHPEDTDYIYAYTASFLQASGQHNENIEHCYKALPIVKIKECREFLQQFIVYSLEAVGRIDEAFEIRKQTLEESECKQFVLDDIAEAYEKINDVDNAIKYYELYVEETKGLCDTYIFTKLANFYETKKDYENSYKYFLKAARQESRESTWLWINTGRALALMGKEEEAMFYFQVALKIDPVNANANYYTGLVYHHKEDMYRALHHYTEALKSNPGFPEVYTNLAAIAYNENGDIQEAIQNIEKALTLNPDKQLIITLYLNLSRLYNKVADYDKHEYYKGKMMEAIGFPVEFIEGDDDEEDNEGGIV